MPIIPPLPTTPYPQNGLGQPIAIGGPRYIGGGAGPSASWNGPFVPGGAGAIVSSVTPSANRLLVQTVCEIDPYCCENSWDPKCVQLAAYLVNISGISAAVASVTGINYFGPEYLETCYGNCSDTVLVKINDGRTFTLSAGSFHNLGRSGWDTTIDYFTNTNCWWYYNNPADIENTDIRDISLYFDTTVPTWRCSVRLNTGKRKSFERLYVNGPYTFNPANSTISLTTISPSAMTITGGYNPPCIPCAAEPNRNPFDIKNYNTKHQFVEVGKNNNQMRFKYTAEINGRYLIKTSQLGTDNNAQIILNSYGTDSTFTSLTASSSSNTYLDEFDNEISLPYGEITTPLMIIGTSHYFKVSGVMLDPNITQASAFANEFQIIAEFVDNKHPGDLDYSTGGSYLDPYIDIYPYTYCSVYTAITSSNAGYPTNVAPISSNEQRITVGQGLNFNIIFAPFDYNDLVVDKTSCSVFSVANNAISYTATNPTISSAPVSERANSKVGSGETPVSNALFNDEDIANDVIAPENYCVNEVASYAISADEAISPTSTTPVSGWLELWRSHRSPDGRLVINLPDLINGSWTDDSESIGWASFSMGQFENISVITFTADITWNGGPDVSLILFAPDYTTAPIIQPVSAAGTQTFVISGSEINQLLSTGGDWRISAIDNWWTGDLGLENATLTFG